MVLLNTNKASPQYSSEKKTKNMPYVIAHEYSICAQQPKGWLAEPLLYVCFQGNLLMDLAANWHFLGHKSPNPLHKSLFFSIKLRWSLWDLNLDGWIWTEDLRVHHYSSGLVFKLLVCFVSTAAPLSFTTHGILCFVFIKVWAWQEGWWGPYWNLSDRAKP